MNKAISFKSIYCECLLKMHRRNLNAYFCSEIGLEPTELNVSLVDLAYEELVKLGFVEKVIEQSFMLVSGLPAKHPFRITAFGLKAQEQLDLVTPHLQD